MDTDNMQKLGEDRSQGSPDICADRWIESHTDRLITIFLSHTGAE